MRAKIATVREHGVQRNRNVRSQNSLRTQFGNTSSLRLQNPEARAGGDVRQTPEWGTAVKGARREEAAKAKGKGKAKGSEVNTSQKGKSKPQIRDVRDVADSGAKRYRSSDWQQSGGTGASTDRQQHGSGSNNSQSSLHTESRRSVSDTWTAVAISSVRNPTEHRERVDYLDETRSEERLIKVKNLP